jgi:hypothetical protein
MPRWPDRFFGDAFSHLNPRGATLFSAGLGAWLSEPHNTAAGAAVSVLPVGGA